MHLNLFKQPLNPKQLRNWFKGADTHAVTRWLEHIFFHLEAPSWDDYRCSIHEGAKAANEFLRVLYRSGLWLRPSVASYVCQCGMAFMQNYRICAQHAYNAGKCRFNLKPKLHAYCHIVHEMIGFLGVVGQSALDRDEPSLVNPLLYGCQQDEDFVGQVSLLSRTGNLSMAHEKAMGLYLLNLKQHW